MINNQEEFNRWLPADYDGEFDWDFLLPAWIPTNIQPSDIDAATTGGEPVDIDAVIEREKKVLLFETKRKGTKVSYGASETMTALMARGASAIHVEGKTSDTITGYAVYSCKDPLVTFGTKPIEPHNAVDLIYTCRQWFLWANDKPRQTRKEWEQEIWNMDFERSLGDKVRDKALPWCEWCRKQLRK